MTGDAAQVLKAVAQVQSRLRRQVNITLGGMPGPLSGASSLFGIRVPFAYDHRYCYIWHPWVGDVKATRHQIG